METKKTTLLIILFLTFNSISFAQSKYLRFNMGYGLPLGSELITYNHYFNATTGEDRKEGIYGSYGSGVFFQLGGSIPLKGIMGLDLEVGYLTGNKFDSKYVEISDFGTQTKNYSTQAKGYFFTPSVIFTSPSEKIQPYARLGATFGVNKIASKNNDSGNSYHDEEYTGGISLGFKGSVGITFNPASKIQFFSEIDFVSMSYAPTKGEITRAWDLGDYSLDEINFSFKKKVSSSTNDRLREFHPFGSVSLQVGVKVKLK